MSWNYLQEQEAGSTVACCSDTLPSVPSRLSPKIGNCCCKDSATECFRDSLCGTTCVPLKGCRGEALSTSCQGDSHAPTSAQPEKAQESKARTADYGERWRASFARFDRDTSSWKTAQCSLLEDSEECSVIWPRSGMTAGGLAYPLPTVARRTSGIESGFWQTPVADDCVDRSKGKINSRGEPKLSAQVKLWPTPTSANAGNDLNLRCSGDGRTKPNKLGWAVAERMIPTPRANDAEKRGNIDAENPRNGLAGFVCKMPVPDGLMNPEIAGLLMGPKFVEWLMGWPIGSTAFSPLETGKFHEFMRQHGGC